MIRTALLVLLGCVALLALASILVDVQQRTKHQMAVMSCMVAAIQRPDLHLDRPACEAWAAANGYPR